MLQATRKRLAKNAEHARVYKAQMSGMVEHGAARKLRRRTKELRWTHSLHRPPRGAQTRLQVKTMQDRPPISRATCLMFIGPRVQTCSTISESWFDSGKRCASQERYKISKDQPSRLPQTSILVEGHWDTYAILSVSFGDRPAGKIATVALRKTARMEQDIYPIRKISDKSVLDLSLSSTVTIHWAYSGAVHVSPQTFWFQKLPIKI